MRLSGPEVVSKKSDIPTKKQDIHLGLMVSDSFFFGTPAANFDTRLQINPHDEWTFR